MEQDTRNAILELDEYINSCKKRLDAILSTLNWTEESLVKEKNADNPLLQQKEDKDDPPLPESFDCKHSIVIGEDRLKEILQDDNVTIPKKFSDLQLSFTREQKREIYDYVIYHTGKISEPELKVPVPNEFKCDNDMTFAEIVAKAKRKDKKLKRKYRTSKPTHIEEVRNLVHLQMQALAQYFNPEPSNPGRSEVKKKSNEESRIAKDGRSKSRQYFNPKHWEPCERETKTKPHDERGRKRPTHDSQSRERRHLSHRLRQSRSRSRDKSHRRVHSRARSRFRERDRRDSLEEQNSSIKHVHKQKKRKRSKSRSKKHKKSSKSKKRKHRHRESESSPKSKHHKDY